MTTPTPRLQSDWSQQNIGRGSYRQNVKKRGFLRLRTDQGYCMLAVLYRKTTALTSTPSVTENYLANLELLRNLYSQQHVVCICGNSMRVSAH